MFRSGFYIYQLNHPHKRTLWYEQFNSVTISKFNSQHNFTDKKFFFFKKNMRIKYQNFKTQFYESHE